MRKRMGIKTAQQDFLDDVIKESNLPHGEQVDWIMKEHFKNQGALEKMYDDEISRQRMVLEEKLARRKALAQISVSITHFTIYIHVCVNAAGRCNDVTTMCGCFSGGPGRHRLRPPEHRRRAPHRTDQTSKEVRERPTPPIEPRPPVFFLNKVNFM